MQYIENKTQHIPIVVDLGITTTEHSLINEVNELLVLCNFSVMFFQVQHTHTNILWVHYIIDTRYKKYIV